MKKKPSQIRNQKGQTFVEFILLFISIFAISLGTLVLTNRQIAGWWAYSVKEIVNHGPNHDRMDIEVKLF